MADGKSRNTNNGASTARKSKNEIIRSALGMYLKQRNYSSSEKDVESEKVKKLGEEDILLKKRITHKLKHMRRAVLEMKTHEQPIRVFKVENGHSRLSAGTVDPFECHLACGFYDSTIQLWQINRSTIGGRKPYASYSNRCCQWSLENNSETSSSDCQQNGRRVVIEKRNYTIRHNCQKSYGEIVGDA